MRSIVVGSGALGDEVQLRVRDPYVSAQHARIVRHDDGTLWVADLGSTNGTRLTRAGIEPLRALATGMPTVVVRGAAEPWRAAWTLWFGGRVGLTLDQRGWVCPVRSSLP